MAVARWWFLLYNALANRHTCNSGYLGKQRPKAMLCATMQHPASLQLIAGLDQLAVIRDFVQQESVRLLLRTFAPENQCELTKLKTADY